MELVTDVGPVPFRFASVRTGVFDAEGARSFLAMEDGTHVARLERDGGLYLVVDHRRDPDGTARIEFWECAGPAPEFALHGLYALCDAATIARPGVTEQRAPAAPR